MIDTPNNTPTAEVPDDGDGSITRWMSALNGPGAGDAEQRAGDQIGPYRLVSLIGEGGFGMVWLAERQVPFIQRVALKLIKPGMDSKSVIARFEQERQALALMDHPGIARVLDGGLTQHGRPYFAMEYVQGEPITEYCDKRKLSIRARLELFSQACDAVQHAHLKGVVHRDIKPSNILAFDSDDAKPLLKVIDFGIAKALSRPLTEHTIYTESGQMIGTPAYMSPEQAGSATSDIDTRSDIYSLGVLLYELMTGALPYEPKELRAKAYAEMQRVIREEDPPTPSARLTTLATKDAARAQAIEAARGIALRDLARELRSELEWIPLKAIRKEPADRYQTTLDLARDVAGYLAGKPISAAPESSLYRIRKWYRRNRAAVASATFVILALGIGIAIQPLSERFSRLTSRVKRNGFWAALQRSDSDANRFQVLTALPDPNVVLDAAVRRAMAEQQLPWRIQHEQSGITLLLVTPGAFSYPVQPFVPLGMEALDAVSQRRVATATRFIHEPFYLSETKVSIGQWLAMTGQDLSDQFTIQPRDSDAAVIGVSWTQIHDEFLALTFGALRLPTEAEWNYARLAGAAPSPHQQYWRYLEETDHLQSPVPNRLGFKGMHLGMEFVQDPYQFVVPIIGFQRSAAPATAAVVALGGRHGVERLPVLIDDKRGFSFRVAMTPTNRTVLSYPETQ